MQGEALRNIYSLLYQNHKESALVLVQVLPKSRFVWRISIKFNCEKTQRKSPKPLWFRTFLRRYLNRFALLVAEGTLEPTTRCSGLLCLCDEHLRQSVLRISPFAVPEKIIGLTLTLDFFDRCTLNSLAVSATGSAKPFRPNKLRSSVS